MSWPFFLFGGSHEKNRHAVLFLSCLDGINPLKNRSKINFSLSVFSQGEEEHRLWSEFKARLGNLSRPCLKNKSQCKAGGTALW